MWVILSPPTTGDVESVLMQRLAERYADSSNADYVQDLTLHRELFVYYVAAGGGRLFSSTA